MMESPNKNSNGETISVEKTERNEVDLEEALSISGFGLSSIKYSLVLALLLIASIVEVMGYAYVLPSARCDLNLSDSQRGVLGSLPYIFMVVTSFPWGYLVDTRGRRSMMLFSSTMVSVFSIIAAFMPEIISYTLCKALANVFIACPSAAPYTYLGEVIPKEHRDLLLSATNALQMFGSALVPLMAWGILPLDFSTSFGIYDFRPWRLLGILYVCPFIIGSLILWLYIPESPKYLLARGKHDEALKVLADIYATNKRKHADDYPVKSLKMPKEDESKPVGFLNSLKVQTIPVIKPPYLKWLLLNGFLLFGVFSVLNGLFMWVPDLLNRVLSGTDVEDKTACEIIKQGLNATLEETAICDDSIDISTFIINTITNMAFTLILFACSFSLKIIGKKTFLFIIYLILGSFCVAINFITETYVFIALMMSLQVIALGIGAVNAYAVDIFPTHLRGMAVGLGLMIGRSGSAIGANVAGILINSACEVTFYGFGGLLLLCCCMTLLLPKSKRT